MYTIYAVCPCGSCVCGKRRHSLVGCAASFICLSGRERRPSSPPFWSYGTARNSPQGFLVPRHLLLFASGGASGQSWVCPMTFAYKNQGFFTVVTIVHLAFPQKPDIRMQCAEIERISPALSGEMIRAILVSVYPAGILKGYRRKKEIE